MLRLRSTSLLGLTIASNDVKDPPMMAPSVVQEEGAFHPPRSLQKIAVLHITSALTDTISFNVHLDISGSLRALTTPATRHSNSLKMSSSMSSFDQNAGMRLYGGAQYHRAMAEFRFVVGGIKCPPINREEIVNACGVEDIHDGTNYFRTACVIAVAKARDTFEPFLHQANWEVRHGNARNKTIYGWKTILIMTLTQEEPQLALLMTTEKGLPLYGRSFTRESSLQNHITVCTVRDSMQNDLPHVPVLFHYLSRRFGIKSLNENATVNCRSPNLFCECLSTLSELTMIEYGL
eukprot:Gb_04151 [translate_table: standard]